MGHTVDVLIPPYSFLPAPPPGVTLVEADGNWDAIYGGEDEQDRFVTFSERALKRATGADILHLHDWPTAWVAGRTSLPTLLTIHNAAYQGGGLLAQGIRNATLVSTVSPTYARELLTPEYGCGLESLLARSPPHGILNGIDTDYWDPQRDPLITQTYSDPSGKKMCKEALCRKLGLPTDRPLFAAICRLVEQKGPHLLHAAFEHIAKQGYAAVLLASSAEGAYTPLFTSMEDPAIHIHFGFDEPLAHLVYAAADYILIPSLFEPCGLTQLIGMRYGAIPIAHAVGGLADTVREGETGYTFDEPTPEAFCGAIERAVTSGTRLADDCMRVESSWEHSASAYIDLYNQAII
jgi:starch synthase